MRLLTPIVWIFEIILAVTYFFVALVLAIIVSAEQTLKLYKTLRQPKGGA